MRRASGWSILALAALLAAPTAPAAFVAAGSILGPGTTTFQGWEDAYSVVDGSDLGQQMEWNFHRVWMALGTRAGGVAESSPENPIEYVYLRVDHKHNSVAPRANWNIQLNFGTAQSGHVDHLLSMRAEGPDHVLVRLSEYDEPFPRLGVFTTEGLTERVNNQPGADDFYPGVLARTGKWDGNHYGFEIAIPPDWIARAPAAKLTPDGAGADWLTGATFSSGGAFGSVSTTHDVLEDDAGTVMTIVADASTGATTFEPAGAVALAIVQSPPSGVAGQPMGPVAVHVHDEMGLLVNSTFYITLSLTGAEGELLGTRVVQAVEGVASFADLAVDRSGSFTLMAHAANLHPGHAPLEIVARAPAINVLGVAAADGSIGAGLWGGWQAAPGVEDVRASNFLAVQNTGNIDEVAFRIAFAPEGLGGQADAAWAIPVASLQIRCAFTSGTPQEAFSQHAAWGSDAPGSAACAFPAGSRGHGTMYVQYRIDALPEVLPAQAYQGSFTVHLEE